MTPKTTYKTIQAHMRRIEGVECAEADEQHRTFADINYKRVWAWGYVDPFPT